MTTGRQRPSNGSKLIVHHTRTLRPDEIQIFRGFPVTSPARTLADIASSAPRKILELALESVIRRELATRQQLHEWIEKASRAHPGKAALRTMLERLSEEVTGSPLEVLLWQLVRDNLIPEPVRQFIVLDDHGIFVARPDFAFPTLRIALEGEGWEAHSKRRDWMRDRRRLRALIALGWIVYPVTWEDITHRPKTVAREIVQLIGQRRAVGRAQG